LDNTAEHLKYVDPDQLPPQVRELVRCIGLSETYTLLKDRGGAPLYIPETYDRAWVLRQMLEPESVMSLIKAYHGRQIEMPKADKILLQLRNNHIREQKKETGMNNCQIAIEHNLSRRHVINILREEDETEVSGDLFHE
jgi:hypothetical protein